MSVTSKYVMNMWWICVHFVIDSIRSVPIRYYWIAMDLFPICLHGGLWRLSNEKLWDCLYNPVPLTTADNKETVLKTIMKICFCKMRFFWLILESSFVWWSPTHRKHVFILNHFTFQEYIKDMIHKSYLHSNIRYYRINYISTLHEVI